MQSMTCLLNPLPNRSENWLHHGHELLGRRRAWAPKRSCKKIPLDLRVRAAKFEVTELLICLQANASAEPEACEAALDSLWSLQYMTGPGILCAFAASAGSHGQAADSSHTAHFRFTDAKAAERFQLNPKVEEWISQSVGPAPLAFDRQLTMSFSAEAPADLEGMFRRGPEWESGVEHLLLVEASSGCNEAAAEEHVAQLSEVATSSLGCALQSTYGTLQQSPSLSMHLQASGGKIFAIMSRFQYLDQLRDLLNLPPWQRMLQGDGTPPVKLLFTTNFTIAEAQKSKNT